MLRIWQRGDVSLNHEGTYPRPPDAGQHDERVSLAVKLLSDLLRESSRDADAAINNALARLGRFCAVERCFVCRFRQGPHGEEPETTHEWYAEGIAHYACVSLDQPGDKIGPWREHVSPDQAIEIEDVGELPESAPVKAMLQRRGVRALVAFPMLIGGQVAGLVGMDDLKGRRRFRRSEVELLNAVANAISALMAQADATQKVTAAHSAMAEARDRLSATLGALPELVIEVDADGRYTGVHTADPGQMMVPADRMIGLTHEEAMPADIAALNRRAMAEVDATGRSGPHPFWADTPRGRRRYAVTVSARPPHLPGAAPGYVFVSRDITEEWRLARDAERLGLIARRMTDLVMIIGLDDRIDWVNPAFEARTGWSLEDARGRSPKDLLHAPDTDPAVIAELAEAMTAGRPAQAELLSRTRDGTEFWTDIDLQPLHDSDGTLTGYVSIETDITERKQQAAQLEQLAREATDASKRLELAIEALPDAFAYFDADDRLVMSNSRYRNVFPKAAALMVPGARFEDILRAAVSSGDWPEAKGREEEWIAERMEHHRNHQGAMEQQIAGRWMRIIERATPDGGRGGMRIDITEVKEAERRLADIIHGAEAGTWEWHLPSDINLINARWAEIVGYTLDELKPLTIDVWRRLVHPEDLAVAHEKLGDVFGGKTDQFEYELRMRHKNGDWVRVLSRGRVARWSSDGRPEMMAGVHIDITALKRAEERLAEIIDAAAAGTWEIDVTSRDMRINDLWANMLGYEREELEGRPEYGFRDLVHPDDLAALDAQHDTRIVGGTDRFANEIRMRHKKGHWVWVLSRGQVMARDVDGTPLKIAGIHLDITERMRLETELTVERDYLARLMDTSASGIAAMDGDGRIIFANREAERILGLKASAINDMAFDAPEWSIAALDGGPFPTKDLPFPRVMAEGRTVRDIRFSIAKPDGTRRMLSVNAAPITTDGLNVRVVCSINDITEQVGAEDALRLTAQKAEAANRSKSQFLANMSHEIRTPLNGVLGMAQVLEGELSDPGHREMLATIRASGEVLLGVLNDVLDMSKIEAGKLALEQTCFVPAELATRIEALHGLQAREKGLGFELVVAPDAQATRLGDVGRLAQIMHNLVGNAVKFTESGRVTVTLSTGAEDSLELTVRDTGIGMTDEQLSRVFDDFEQADGTVTRRFGGTGLGMSIVRRLVDLMGGVIEVDSTPDVGTEVRVRVPLARADPDPAAAPARTLSALVGLRVLAADDNRTNRTILKSMLARLGVDVVLAEDGRAVLDAWEAGQFDMYLLDISMPGLDGISALRHLRAFEVAAGQAPTPALAITANVMSHQVDEYLEAGFSGHLGKPFRRDDLADALVTAIAARD